MSPADQIPTQESPNSGERRGRQRRTRDMALRQLQTQQAHQLKSLLELSQLIGSDLRLEPLLYQVAQKASDLMKAERCSIFLYDPVRDELWTTVALGIEGKIIRIPAQAGIAGSCFQEAAAINLADAYGDPRFSREVDIVTGYRTRSVLCLPIFKRDQTLLGVIQLLNKIEGTFTEEDELFLKTYANHAAVFLEIAQLQKARIEALETSREELRRLNRAKDKALDRLSHELQTPLSVIQGNIRILKQRLQKLDSPPVGTEFFQTLEKHLSRLSEIQKEADTIIRLTQEQETGNLSTELKEIWDKIESQSSIPLDIRNHWEVIRGWLDTAPLRPAYVLEEVDLWVAAEKALNQVRERGAHRGLSFALTGERPLLVSSNFRVVEEVLTALLKNAMENTPDEGQIRLEMGKAENGVFLKVQDSGIGIIPEDQQSLFEGLYHTQSTELYSSKKPFDFGAGGKGLDLLKARLSGRRFNFFLSVESQRCVFLPRDTDQCSGRISQCSFCNTAEDCRQSGGTTLSLTFSGSAF
jgi:signal transduction histidine kinase